MRVEEHRDAAAAQLLEQQAHRAAADRVERRGRLVEQQQARLADERLRDAEPLLHPLRHPVDAACPGAPRARRARAGASARRRRRASRRAAGAARAPRRPCTSRGSGRAPRDSRARARAAREPARAPATSARRRSARTSPTAIFTSVDLPAPFGPSSPTSSPSPTSRSTPLQRLDGAVALREPADGESRRHGPSLVGSTLKSCRADTWKVPPPKRRSGSPTRRAPRRSTRTSQATLYPAVYGCTDGRSRAALPRLAHRRRPGRALRVRQGVGRDRAPRRRSALTRTLAAERRDELVDRQRGQRLDPRRAARRRARPTHARPSPCRAPRRR